MTKGQAVERLGQQFEEGLEVGFVELLGWGELPQDGAELWPQLAQALVEEAPDRFPRLGAR